MFFLPSPATAIFPERVEPASVHSAVSDALRRVSAEYLSYGALAKEDMTGQRQRNAEKYDAAIRIQVE